MKILKRRIWFSPDSQYKVSFGIPNWLDILDDNIDRQWYNKLIKQLSELIWKTVQWKSKTRVTSSNPRVTSTNPRVTSSNPRVTSTNPRVTSSNPRVTSLNLRVRESLNPWKLK